MSSDKQSGARTEGEEKGRTGAKGLSAGEVDFDFPVSPVSVPVAVAATSGGQAGRWAASYFLPWSAVSNSLQSSQSAERQRVTASDPKKEIATGIDRLLLESLGVGARRRVPVPAVT